MSVQATTWVWEHSQSEKVTRLVALALADAANAQGSRSCQSVATIAAMVHASERTVQRALRELEALGEIVQTGYDGHYRTSIYAFPRMGDKSEPAPPMGDTSGSMGDISEPMGDIFDAMGDTAMSPDPSTPLPHHYPSSAPVGRSAPDDASTLRMNIHPGAAAPKPRKRATSVPSDFVPNDRHREIATERGVDLRAEWVKLTDWALANGKTFVDWDAAFRNWLNKARPERAGGTGDRWQDNRRRMFAEWDQRLGQQEVIPIDRKALGS